MKLSSIDAQGIAIARQIMHGGDPAKLDPTHPIYQADVLIDTNGLMGPNSCASMALGFAIALRRNGIPAIPTIGGAAWAVGPDPVDLFEFGYPHFDLENGKYHCWVETRTRILDPSARYFGEVLRASHAEIPFSRPVEKLRQFDDVLVHAKKKAFLNPLAAATDYRRAHVYKAQPDQKAAWGAMSASETPAFGWTVEIAMEVAA